MAFLYTKEGDGTLIKDLIGKQLTLACTSLDDKGGPNKLAYANAMLCLKERWDQLEEIKKSLVVETPIEFATLLLRHSHPDKAIEIVNTILKENVQRMKARASYTGHQSTVFPTYIPAELFRQVKTRCLTLVFEVAHRFQQEKPKEGTLERDSRPRKAPSGMFSIQERYFSGLGTLINSISKALFPKLLSKARYLRRLSPRFSLIEGGQSSQ